jgi:EAL domain-containing protein (putative c-di-GMP-specific phosphodiesterase class I)
MKETAICEAAVSLYISLSDVLIQWLWASGKIDGSFVCDMLSNSGDLVMVEAITQIALALGIQVIAEHATNLETINRLREIGVESAQGYGIGFPIPVGEAWKCKVRG